MIVVRYVTLVALVLWLGAMVDERFGGLFGGAHLLAYVCGGATVVGLFTLKFLGPPPRTFVLRAAIAVLMLALAGGAALLTNRDAASLLLTVNIALGLVLLTWYVRE